MNERESERESERARERARETNLDARVDIRGHVAALYHIAHHLVSPYPRLSTSQAGAHSSSQYQPGCRSTRAPSALVPARLQQ
eukprot:911231-Rhodomonas_salina.2